MYGDSILTSVPFVSRFASMQSETHRFHFDSPLRSKYEHILCFAVEGAIPCQYNSIGMILAKCVGELDVSIIPLSPLQRGIDKQ